MIEENGAAVESGFTLIEVLVALAILAVVFGFAMESLSGSFYWQERSHQDEIATLVAQETMARVGHDIPLKNGRVDGRTAGGYAWQVDISAYGDATAAARARLIPHRIDVIVGWTEGNFLHRLRLTGLRLAPAGLTQ
jgi:type II secretion system protein I